MRFDLERWGDGEIHLAHWDVLHGNDIILTLSGSTATLTGPNGEQDVNLAEFLCQVLEKAESEQS